MTVIDKILNEWSYRCDDGIVDLTDATKVKILFEILREDIDDDLLSALVKADPDTKAKVLKFIKKSTSKSAEKGSEDGFYNYLDKHNLNDAHIGSLSDQIFEILSDNDDLDKFNEYRKSPLKLSGLGQTGNILTTLGETGVSQTSLVQLLNLIGQEGGRGIGKGEILLALFFSDAKISEGKGDITSSEGSVEIKAYDARLGTRGTSASLFTNSDLAKLAIDYEIDSTRIDILIPSLIEEADNNVVYKAAIDFLKNIFTKIDITQYLTPDIIKSQQEIRLALNKIYVLDYFTKEGIDRMIYINTDKSTGPYVSFTSDEIAEVINNKLIKIGTFTSSNMNPQIV
jgi:hypothetical protein